MKKLSLLALTAALVSLNMPAFADDSMEDLNQAVGALTAKVDAMSKGGPSVEIHGFVQSDYINDSTQSFAETVGDGAVQLPGQQGSNGQTQFSLRNTRISLLGKESISDWMFKGYVETDFLGVNDGAQVGGNEYKFFTQPTLRLRHAYVEGDTTDGWQILAGQYWTLFGWNMDYVLATVAEAPVMGTMYERIPQLTVKKNLGDDKGMQVQLAVSAEEPDQTIGQVPNLNWGVRFVMNDMKGYFCSSTGATKLQSLSIGFSQRNADYWYSDGRDGNILDSNMWGSALAVDALIPLLPASEGKDEPSIVLTGEYSYGAGDTLPFNGGIGMIGATGSVTQTGGKYGYVGGTVLDASEGAVIGNELYLIQLESYNAQLQVTLPRSIGTIFTGGYGEVFSPNASNTGMGGTFNDDSNWFVNVMQDVSKNVRVGAEYSQYYTHYISGGLVPTDQRIQISTWYRF